MKEKRSCPFIIFNWRRMLLSVNEGYGPINFSICLKYHFFYIYFFGHRYWTHNFGRSWYTGEPL